MIELERHRKELAGYCYRMLGSGFEAEDAVQETMAKAWKSFDPDRGPLRPWLYGIATNVCIDMLRSAQRRARAMDFGPAAEPGAPLSVPIPYERWVYPMPDQLLDPAELAVSRESIRLAFVAALQHLPPRQRAVLILRDVLSWSAAEVAELLESSVASVNSALQRARAAMPATPQPHLEIDEELLARYVKAFERFDVDELVALVHEDAIESMPPFGWWLDGREAIRSVMIGALASGTAPCEGSTLVRAGANTFAQYLNGEAFAIVILEASGGLLTGMTTYLDTRLFELYDLPMSFGGPDRT